jgi:hypothetical protein
MTSFLLHQKAPTCCKADRGEGSLYHPMLGLIQPNALWTAEVTGFRLCSSRARGIVISYWLAPTASSLEVLPIPFPFIACTCLKWYGLHYTSLTTSVNSFLYSTVNFNRTIRLYHIVQE